MARSTGQPVLIEIDYRTEREFVSPAFIVRLRDLYGMEVVRLATMPISGYEIERLHPQGRVQLLIPKLTFVAGHYLVDVDFVRSGVSTILSLEHLLEFYVEPADYYGSGRPLDRSRGLIVVDHSWNHIETDRQVEARLPS
jgi:hypothetical protein